MSLSRRARSRLLLLASLSAPVLAAQAVRLIGAAGPSRSAGSVVSAVADPGVVPPAKTEPTEKQTRAMQWLRLRDADRPVRCPMQQPDRPAEPPVTPLDTPTTEPTVPAGPDPITAWSATRLAASR